MGLNVAFVMEATHGGTARHLLELANGLIADGHSVHVIYSRLRAEPRFVKGLSDIPGIRIAIVDMRREPHPSDALACIAIRRYLQKMGPFDVVHGHSSKGGALARLAAWGLPVARIYTPHCFRTADPGLGLSGRIAYGGAELILAHLCDAIIAVSPDEMEHAIRLGIPRGKVHLVFNGVDQAQRPDRAAQRGRLGLVDDEVCVGFLARYVPQKAPERLLEVVTELRSTLPPFRIAMVGDGPLESMLRSQALAMGIADRIIFAPGSFGPEVMSAFDIFVLPSAYEAMPYVLLEAAVSGLPIVATAVGGASSVVISEKNGYLVPNWDRGMFAEQLSRIIQDKELRARMGRASLETGKIFTLGRMIRQTTDVYRTGIDRRARLRVEYKHAVSKPSDSPSRSGL
jgi:glycosyltransferase involved in cell wall biosynthesis